ncbi:tryptophan halogenase [Sphingopyxis panaciterrulae]|uniref:Tryptophan halogenase n=1 Tax=Sphingopyxis panaciterrulae TaxID=462372 RepID=A0A7W9B2S1_9SPHN|nr:tryptophan halogenase [Sphingopyxis panaciterrulae]
MGDSRITKVVIVGGGTAGWMAAAALSRTMDGLSIRLVESEEIGTVGVGEATIPSIRLFNALIGLDEDDFVRETRGSFKLGVQFHDWGQLGDVYMHAFGQVGRSLGMLPFQQYWLRGRAEGVAGRFGDYSLNETVALQNRFARLPHIPNTSLDGIAYAFHFDAALYAAYLRRIAEAAGVERTEGKIAEVRRNGESGHVEAVVLENGTAIEGELFIDCSGFRALLIEGALETGFEDWTHWLPCDRAIAVPSENAGPARPYTQAFAHRSGWQWRIPLQHRTGNGHVFCSDFLSEDEAAAILLANIEGRPLAEPRTLRFRTGMRQRAWSGNVVALGLASGFLEPIESTSIHLIQNGIARLLAHFPDRDFDAANIDAYNRRIRFDHERIRDFIILHYHANQRTDSSFWTRCREMAIPETLARKIALFRSQGQLVREGDELFVEIGWFQVLTGQNIVPRGYHPMADQLSREELSGFVGDIETIVAGAASRLPTHDDFIAQHCAAGVPA